ncbi:MAG: RdgB/HAM1 family non-canonical purine NTP pyrophosphatase [Gammaproteobacteria bacterium]|nr:RdgB/HAM1 family non-canonical purine NTP pyrophosphatase [Gammaproteobacteria bacterium]
MPGTRSAIVLASGNPAKRAEIERMLSPVRIIPQAELFVGDAEETGLSFTENAILKARFAAERTGLPSLADDSGLETDALGGAPGVRSARFAGEGASDDDNLRKLLAELKGVPDDRRTARFRCVICFLRHAGDPIPLICEGTWEGSIAQSPRGTNGFGYDPVFLVGNGSLTAAELDPAIKDRLSHRGQALAELARQLAGC